MSGSIISRGRTTKDNSTCKTVKADAQSIPRLVPIEAKAMALPVLDEKYVDKTRTPEENTRPMDIPIKIPCTPNTWPNVVQKLVHNKLINKPMLPPRKHNLKYPMLTSGFPIKTQKKVAKI